jgi:hypothetical protein
MVNELEEWKEALPERKEHLSITLQPSIDRAKGTVDWTVTLRSDRLEPDEKYWANCSFTFSSQEYVRTEGGPLQIDYVVSQMEASLEETIRKYIINEVIDDK